MKDMLDDFELDDSFEPTKIEISDEARMLGVMAGEVRGPADFAKLHSMVAYVKALDERTKAERAHSIALNKAVKSLLHAFRPELANILHDKGDLTASGGHIIRSAMGSSYTQKIAPDKQIRVDITDEDLAVGYMKDHVPDLSHLFKSALSADGREMFRTFAKEQCRATGESIPGAEITVWGDERVVTRSKPPAQNTEILAARLLPRKSQLETKLNEEN